MKANFAVLLNPELREVAAQFYEDPWRVHNDALDAMCYALLNNGFSKPVDSGKEAKMVDIVYRDMLDSLGWALSSAGDAIIKAAVEDLFVEESDFADAVRAIAIARVNLGQRLLEIAADASDNEADRG